MANSSGLFAAKSGYTRLRNSMRPEDKLRAMFADFARNALASPENSQTEDWSGRTIVPGDAEWRVTARLSDEVVLCEIYGMTPAATARLIFLPPQSIERLGALKNAPARDNVPTLLRWALSDERSNEFDVPRILSALPDVDAEVSPSGEATVRVPVPSGAEFPSTLWLAVVEVAKELPDDLVSWIVGNRSDLSKFLELDTALEIASAKSMWDAAAKVDPLFVVLAGEEDEAVFSSPVWYTRLAQSPEEIVWMAEPASRHFSVSGREAGVLLEGEVESPCIVLPEVVQERINGQSEVYWEASAPSVRGYFSVVRHEQPDDLKTTGDPLADLSVAMRLAESGYFEESIRILKEVDGDARPIAYRALSRVYLMVRQELSGDRQLGHPEGVWAAAIAHRYLWRSYQLLGEQP